MRSAKLQLENYFVEELFFRFQQPEELTIEPPTKLKPSDLDVKIALGETKENTNKKLCHLTISLKEEVKNSFPYNFSVTLVGFFEIDSSCPDGEVDLLLKTNAPSMLFTAARELLLIVTGRARYYPLMLPTIAFLPNKKEENTVTKEKKSNRGKPKSRKT